MDYESIIREYGLAGNLIPIDSNSPEVISYSKFGERVAEGEDVTGLVPVVENPSWILQDEKGDVISGNERGKIIRIPATRNKVLILEKARYGLSPRHIEMFKVDEGLAKQKYNTIKRQKEDKNMAGTNLFEGMNQDALDKIQKGAKDMGASNPVKEMDLEGKAKEAGMSEGGSTEEFDDVLKAVGDYNRNYGRLHAIITAQDHRVNFALAKKAKNSSKGVGTGDSHAAVSEKKTLVVKDTKPGAIKGGIISIPTDGLFTSAQLKDCQNGVTELPAFEYKSAQDTPTVTFMLSKDELIDQVLFGFDGLIQQDEATYGTAADMVEAIKTQNTKKDDKTGEEKLVTSRRLKASKDCPLVHPNAYFPLKMFKYLDPKKANLDLLNFSAFYHFTKSGANTLDNIDDSQKDLITVNDKEKMEIDGVKVAKITSKIYTVNGSTPDMTAPVWYSKDDHLADLSIPCKKAIPNKTDPTSVSARIVTIDCLKGASDSSLADPAFEAIRSRFSTQLCKVELAKKFGRAKGGGTAADKERLRQSKRIARAELLRDQVETLKAFDDLAAKHQHR